MFNKKDTAPSSNNDTVNESELPTVEQVFKLDKSKPIQPQIRTLEREIERLKMPQKDDVFEYTGNGQIVPKDVVRVQFHPSVVRVEDDFFTRSWNMGGVAKGIAFMECIHLREVVLNEGLQVIGKEAFDGCKSLTSITFPSTVTSVDQSFFRNKSLKKVVLNEGLKSIGWKSFCDCPSLECITIPSTVVEIGQVAFCSCINMKEVVLNEGLQKIGRSSFNGCTSLKSIRLPSTLTEIHDRAFSVCSNLREVEFNSEGLQVIFYDAFTGCTSLERFIFPGISARLNSIIKTGQFDVVNEIDSIRGPLEWKDGESINISSENSINKRRWS